MTQYFKLWLAVSAMVGLAGQALQAQGEVVERKDTVQVSLKQSAAFTDNRDSVQTNKESNLDLSLVPRITLNLQPGRTLFDFYYEPTFRYRTDPSVVQNDTEVFHDLGASVNHELTDQWIFRFKENFIYADDPSLEDGGFTVRSDRTYLRNRLESGVRLRASEYSFADVSGRHEIKRYKEDDVAAESDEDQVGAKLMLWKQVAKTVALVGTGGYSSYGFDSASGIERDFDSLLGAVGLEKVFNPTFRTGVRAGMQTMSYADSGLSNESFPYGELSLYLTPSLDTRVTGRLGLGARDADVYPFASQEYKEANIRGEWDASKLITWGLSGTYRNSDYTAKGRPESAPESAFVGATDGTEDTIVLRADIAFALGKISRLRLAELYEDVSSDVAESFTKNTSIVSLEFEF